MHSHAQAHVHARCTRAHTSTRAHTYASTCTHPHAHTFTHTHCTHEFTCTHITHTHIAHAHGAGPGLGQRALSAHPVIPTARCLHADDYSVRAWPRAGPGSRRLSRGPRRQAWASAGAGQLAVHSQAPGACLLRGPLCFFHGPAQMREPLSARPGLPPRPGFPPGGPRRRLPMQHRGPRPAGRGVGICILTRSPGDASSASSLRSRRLPRAEAAFHACHSQADFTERRCTSPAAGCALSCAMTRLRSAAPSSRVSLREQHAGPRTHMRGLPRRGAPRRPGWNRPRAGF